MNPNYGYQVYQAERTRTRAEVLAQDARRGRGTARAARTVRAWGIMAVNTIAGRAARARTA